MRRTLHLRSKNRTPEALSQHASLPHLSRDFPLKPKVEKKTARPFQIVSLPQQDGSFVASVLEAPQILVYDRSRKAAEDRATKEFLKIPDPLAYKRHPLATTKPMTIEMEYDKEVKAFVTYVKELRGISTFGETEFEALENTVEVIRGYIQSMVENRKKISLAAHKLAELKSLVRLT